MMMMAAAIGLNRLQRLLCPAEIAGLQCLPELRQGACPLAAGAARQARKCLLRRSDVTRLQR